MTEDERFKFIQYFEAIKLELSFIKDNIRIFDDVMDKAKKCFEEGKSVENRWMRDIDYSKLNPKSFLNLIQKIKKDILVAKRLFMDEI